MRKSFAPSFRSSIISSVAEVRKEATSSPRNLHGDACNSTRSTGNILNLLNERATSQELASISRYQQLSSVNNSSQPGDYVSKEDKYDRQPDLPSKCDESETFHPPQSVDFSTSPKRKYTVVWGKLSKKKHKTWEGDGVAEVGLHRVVLKDCDGKVLGSTKGVKTEQLEEGSRLIVGGKEIELIDLIPEYGKGDEKKDVIHTKSPVNSENVRPPKRPKLMVSKRVRCTKNDTTDTLVMPIPPSEHQWLYNQEKLPLVDVVVDSHLSQILRPHQRFGVQFLYECVSGMRNPFSHQTGLRALWQGCILADEMGLGKTLQCITLIWTLLKKGPYGNKPVFHNVLIVTPSSLAANWMKEFQRWLGREKIKPFIVNQKNRPIEYLKSCNNQVMVISYEMVVRYIVDVKKIHFDIIICDEGHRLKNTVIKTSQALSQLNVKRRILLTGTPIQNDLQEFYSLVDFVNPGILGSSIEFRKHYEVPIVASRQPNSSEEKRCLGETRAAELNKRTSWFILRRTQEIINQYLPKKVEAVIFCRPFPLQVKLYKSTIAFWEMQCNKGEDSGKGVAHLAVLTALKKICNHPKLLLTSESEEEGLLTELQSELERESGFSLENLSEHSGKLWFVENLLQNLSLLKEKVILVSYYTQTLDIFAALCESQNYKYCRLDGSTPTSKRMAIVDSFNSHHQNNFVFLLSARAGGVGLNLTGASWLVLYDSDWNPASDLQAMARIWRDGQSKSVYIYRLLTTGTIEEKIYQRQINKTGLSGAVVDPKNPSNIKLSLEELKDLFTFYETTSCLTHDLLDCKCATSDSMANIALFSFPDEVEDNDERECQLCIDVKSLQKASLPISQLNSWQHLSSPFEDSVIQDMGFSFAPRHISFIFQNSTE